MSKEMAEEKDAEVERLRRLVYPIHEDNPSRIKRIMNRLAVLTKDNSKLKENKDIA